MKANNPITRPTLAWSVLSLTALLLGFACSPRPAPTTEPVPEVKVAPPTSAPASAPASPLPSAGTATLDGVGQQIVDPPNAKTLEAHLSRNEHVWVDGDTLVFAIRAPEASSVRVGGGVQRPLQKVDDTDLWALAIKAKGLDGLVVQWALSAEGKQEPIGFGIYRGPKAPRAVEVVESLVHPVQKHAFKSRHLDATRDVFVYRAPGSCEGSPLVVMADGQMLESMVPAIEKAIMAGVIEPLIIVGVANGPATGPGPENDRRFIEYVPSASARGIQIEVPNHAAIHAAHMRFVIEEVVPWIIEERGAARTPARRAVVGFSNGAVFAASAAIAHPDTFGHAIALSSGESPGEPSWTGTLAPRFFISAGTLEERFAKASEQLARKTTAASATTTLRFRVGGHDAIIWQEELVLALTQTFPNPTE